MKPNSRLAGQAPTGRRTTRPKHRLAPCLAALGLALTASQTLTAPALGQGTTISYHGQLSQAGTPADGKFDLRVALYPALTGGSPIGPTLTLPAVAVAGGGFTVDLDFGAGAFNGQPRWLELAVKPVGAATFTTLAPRQALNAVPYALFALTPAGPTGPKGDTGPQGPVGPKGDKGDPGPSRLSDADLFFRGSTDNFHGLGWFGAGKPFGTEIPDGPVLYGSSGGALGSHNADGTQLALRWSSGGTVAIGQGAKPAGAPLHVAAEGGSGDQFILGSPRLENGDTALVMGLTDAQGGASYLQSIAATGSAYGDLLVNPDGGRVGIRTRTPTAELEVNGTVKAQRFEGDGSGLVNVPSLVETTGTVVAWGDDSVGRTSVPADLISVAAIATGGNHSVALKEDGTVVAWGRNLEGQSSVPAGLIGVTAIAAGALHSVALKQDGTVVAWGSNPNNFGESTVPAGLSGVIAIAAGGAHTVALKQDGTVVTWGRNDFNQTTAPTGLSGVIAIAAGNYHTVALKQDGSVVAWGLNMNGQSSVPTGLSGVTAIAAGDLHTVALKQDGSIVAWGANSSGQTTVPPGLTGVKAIAAGSYHSVALKQDGTVVTFGNTNISQTPDPVDPAPVPVGLNRVVAIAAGGLHTLALRKSPAITGPLFVSGSVSATAFNTTSDRHAKERFTPVDPQEVLSKVAALPITQWNFKSQPGEAHLGPMAQDFRAAFGLGPDDRHIATVDADGVALTAIQGLHQQWQRMADQNRQLEDRNQQLHRQLEFLERRLLNLESQRSPTRPEVPDSNPSRSNATTNQP